MKSIYKNLKIIGADETGVGDYLTPLVAAAVFVPIQYIPKLEAMGITDSKKLTDKKILELFEQIKPMIKSSVRHLSQKGYNKLNTSFNAHELKTLIHLQAINAVESRVDDIDLIILDQFVNENSFNKYVTKLDKSNLDVSPLKKELKLVTKGEMEHVSVAAASIVARAYFLKMMESQNKRYDMTFPLGTNDRSVACAKEFVQRYGTDKLNEVAKLSFKTTEKVI
ncbi:MAG: ribonuclease HIII [Mycoplasmatales bacterium]|nr:ribonuclease HIII [Mycoplasmatales bacterium]